MKGGVYRMLTIQVHVNQTVSDEKKENPIGRYAAE